MNPSGPGKQGYQRYAYANGNPATLVDPSGHSTLALDGGTGAVDFGAMVRMGKDVFRFSAGMSGLAVPLLAIGAFVSANLGLIALILMVILIMVGVTYWCYQHGCSLPSLDLFGWIQGTVTAGKTAVQMGVAAAAGAAARACTAVLKWLDPLRTKLAILTGCPRLPKPEEPKDEDDNCETLDDEFPDPTDVNSPTDSQTNGQQDANVPDEPTTPRGNPSSPPEGRNPPQNGGPWEWRGDETNRGGPDGNWVNKETGEWWHTSADPGSHGPHWDYRDQDGMQWRRYPDGHWEWKGKDSDKKIWKKIKPKQCS